MNWDENTPYYFGDAHLLSNAFLFQSNFIFTELDFPLFLLVAIGFPSFLLLAIGPGWDCHCLVAPHGGPIEDAQKCEVVLPPVWMVRQGLGAGLASWDMGPKPRAEPESCIMPPGRDRG